MFVFLTPFFVYFINFNDGFAEDQNYWGAFGSYIGGLVSSIFSFLSFIALLYTISNSKKELQQTKNRINEDNKIFKENEIRKDLLLTIDKIDSKLIKWKDYYNMHILNLGKNNISAYPGFVEIIMLLKLMKENLYILDSYQRDNNLIHYYKSCYNDMYNNLFQKGYLERNEF